MRTGESPADTDELNCPLCGYDLRGLPEHRCPECGHAFDVAELRQAKLEKRDWLFEHAPRRLARSFLKTMLVSLRPWRFWKRVSAAIEIVPRRLNLWARLWLALATLLIVGAFTAAVVRDYIAINETLAAVGGSTPGLQAVTRSNIGSITWVMVPNGTGWMQMPTAEDATFSATAVRTFETHALARDGWMLLAVLVWPAVVVLALQVFGKTLNRAGIHRGHLWRCVLYAWPSIGLPAVGMVVLACFWPVNAMSPRQLPGIIGAAFEAVPSIVWRVGVVMGLAPIASLMLGLTALIGMVHLAIAHLRYLRLPHAIVQAVLVQIVSCLAILVMIGILGGGLF
jgi:hypothetical protein